MGVHGAPTIFSQTCMCAPTHIPTHSQPANTVIMRRGAARGGAEGRERRCSHRGRDGGGWRVGGLPVHLHGTVHPCTRTLTPRGLSKSEKRGLIRTKVSKCTRFSGQLNTNLLWENQRERVGALSRPFLHVVLYCEVRSCDCQSLLHVCAVQTKSC